MSKDEVMKEQHLSWLSGDGPDGDVVLMSRVSLARNLKQLPFPNRADFSQLLAVRTQIEQIVPSLAKGVDRTQYGGAYAPGAQRAHRKAAGYACPHEESSAQGSPHGRKWPGQPDGQ